MKRFHVHVFVENIEQSVRFYTTLFAVPPDVERPDYAKWKLKDPRVNFAISTGHQVTGVNHLGIQAENEEELAELGARVEKLHGLNTIKQENISCCYALGDKYWAVDPQGLAWENFHTREEIQPFEKQNDGNQSQNHSECCIPVHGGMKGSDGICCLPMNPRDGEKATSEPCC